MSHAGVLKNQRYTGNLAEAPCSSLRAASALAMVGVLP